MSDKHWIAKAVLKNKGALRRKLGVKKGKISTTKLNSAVHSKNATTKRQANLAKTLRSFK